MNGFKYRHVPVILTLLAALLVRGERALLDGVSYRDWLVKHWKLDEQAAAPRQPCRSAQRSK